MTAPTFKLTRTEVILNYDKMCAFKSDRDLKQNKIYGIGVWAWGHNFVTVANRGRYFDIYHICFNILAKIGVIKTEGSEYFKDLEKYTDREFTTTYRTTLTKTIVELDKSVRELTATNNTQAQQILSFTAENEKLKQQNGDLKKLEVYVQKLEAAAGELTKKLALSEQAIEESGRKFAANDKEFTAAKTQLEEFIFKKEEEIEDLTEELNKVKEQVANQGTKLKEDLAAKTKELDKALTLAAHEKQELTHNFKEVQDKHEALTKEHKQAVGEKEKLLADMKKTIDEIEGFNKIFKKQETEFESLTKEYNTANNTINQLTTERGQLLGYNKELTTKLEAAKAAKADYDNLQQRVTKLTEQLETSKKDYEALDAIINEVAKERDSLKDSHSDVSNDLTHIEQTNEALKAEIEELNSKLAKHMETSHTAEKANLDLRNSFDAKKKEILTKLNELDDGIRLQIESRKRDNKEFGDLTDIKKSLSEIKKQIGIPAQSHASHPKPSSSSTSSTPTSSTASNTPGTSKSSKRKGRGANRSESDSQ